MNCAHHPRCPGCPLLAVPYDEQRRRKRQRLVASFGRYPHLRLPVPDEVAPAAFTDGYRHRVKLPVQISGDVVSAGLYTAGSTEIVDTPDCPVLHPALQAGLDRVRAWLKGRQGIHAIDLRLSASTGQLQLVLNCAGGDLHGGAKGARALMAQVPGLSSVAVSVADKDRKRVLGSAPRVIAGDEHLDEAIGSTRYRLHAGAFFQVDPRNATWLHEKVRAYVGDARSVLDLYAGVGAYALMLAPGRERVVAVEEVPAAARAAQAIAPSNVEVLSSRVEDADLQGPFDVAILNPARRGADPATLQRLARLAKRLVYVSCGPETLARDLDVLAMHGMRVDDVSAVDLFPQTGEVETVVSMVQGPAMRDFPVPGGKASGPWRPEKGTVAYWSGAHGRPARVLALVLGDTGPQGRLDGGRFRKIGEAATHSLIRIDLEGPLVPVLAHLAREGYPVAGRDPRTARFFAERAGLVRPFVHVEVAGKATAPLHGDLAQALVSLGADERTLARAGLGGDAG